MDTEILATLVKTWVKQEPQIFLLPGLIAWLPLLHRGQTAGSYVGTSSVKSVTLETPTSAVPPLRSTIEPAPTTMPPAAVAASIVSLVEPPVVTTSSTTNTFSPEFMRNPRRRVMRPPSRSVKIARTPSARAVSCATMMPPIAGATTRFGSLCSRREAMARPTHSA